MQKAKRFYQQVAPHQTETGWEILLDGKPVRTPERQILMLPGRDLAEAIASEWAAQTEQIKPETMPMTQLAMTALDRVGEQRTAIISTLVECADHDLLSYRVEFPSDLVEWQKKSHDPVLAALARHHDIQVRICYGLTGGGQSAETLDQIKSFFERQDDWALSALQVMVPALGSVGLAIGCFAGWLAADEACAAAMFEETWQAERWGQDAEAAQRQRSIKTEIVACHNFISLLRGFHSFFTDGHVPV